MRSRILCILSALIAALALAPPVSAHANLVRAEPGISASVPVAPATVQLFFSEAPEVRYSEVMLFNATHERFDLGNLRVAPGDRESLIVGVRDLPQGIYTVIWKTTSAVDGHTTGGSFAFAVGAASITGTAATQSTVTFSQPTPLEVLTKWLTYLSASIFLGTLVLAMFIWTPVIAAASTGTKADDLVAAAVNRRLSYLAKAALFVLVAATAVGALAQVAKVTGRSFTGALDISGLRGYLLGTRTGSIWLLRLFLASLAAAVLVPTGLRIVRTAWARDTNVQIIAALLGLAVGANEFATISLISHGAATSFRPPLTIAIDWLHLIAAAIWLGGLIGLVVTVPLIPRGGRERQVLLPAVVGRFSTMALVGVGVLIVTGLYNAWVHVGSLDALRTTEYGRALLLKIALVLGLVLLGAFNLLWVRPRLSPGAFAEPEHEGARTLVRHFRRSIGGEVLLGAAVLLIVAVLTGLATARDAATQTGHTNLTQRARAGDLSVALTPSTLLPGVIAYDVFVTKGRPVTDADRVILRFTSPELGAQETEAVATGQGDGHFTVTGPYTTIAGTWQTRVIVRRAGKDDVSATFAPPIGGTAVPSPAANTAKPAATVTTVLLAIAAMLLVLTLFGGAVVLSRQSSARPARRERSPAPDAARAASGGGVAPQQE